MEAVSPFRAPGRQLSSWIAAFLEYTEGMTTPEIFRRWAAIAAIAGALERKVWIRSQGKTLYPNLYVFLCGPPGIGKSNAYHAAEFLWRAMTDHHVAPVDLTKASFIDTLNGSIRGFEERNVTFHSLLVGVGELGALLPGYDAAFMNTLTYLYDNQPFEERRRTKEHHIKIDSPCINILACTTPGFLNNMLPAGAWDQGFLARVIIVFSDEIVKRDLDLLEEEVRRNEPLEAALQSDIIRIGQMFCKMGFTPNAAAAVKDWNENRNDPPSHPRLQHYNTRRLVHLLKLCMIAAADRGVQAIDMYDFHTAHNWLIEVETFMPDIFKAMTSGGEPQVIAECQHYLRTQNSKTGKPIPSNNIYSFLAQRLPPHSVERAYNVMIKSGMMVEGPGGVVPTGASL